MLKFPYGEPTLQGRFKTRPQDFIVAEELGFQPDGQGEHRLLLVEKTGLSTPELVERIASELQIKTRDIGYSGLKDKRAISRQWISIPNPTTDIEVTETDFYRILESGLHRRKLRRGSHKSNTFEVRLRQVNEFSSDAQAQLECIAQSGFANYFGEQRFGRQQDNVEQALGKLSNPRLPRWRKGILISALRSYLFNLILSRRIEMGIWQQPVEGDVFMLRGSHSIFSETLDDSIRQRYTAQDISSTASLYGSGPCLLSGTALEIEQEIFSAHPEITACLDRHGAKRQMRATRVVPRDLTCEYDSQEQCLLLKLRLPAGSYLTSLLDHCLLRSESDQAGLR